MEVTAQPLLSDQAVIERIFQHIDEHTTDRGDSGWREPTANYRSAERFEAERELMRRIPVPFCPSVALPEPGSYVARTAAGTPLVAVRDDAGTVRVFRNACRHRGMQVVEGTGCAKAMVCPYHAWTYQLDGRLTQVPYEDGFPGLDKSVMGLVPVTAQERDGFVFVIQDDPIGEGALSAPLPQILQPQQRLLHSGESEVPVNWKLNMEAALEGYHIKPLHRESFYPYGFDNLNVVETYGANSRITYPFRRIEKLRDVPPNERSIDGMVTYVYQIFPNVTIAVLSNHTSISIAEPVSPTMTRFANYRLTNRNDDGQEAAIASAKKDANFLRDTGSVEDQHATMAIQESLASGANTHFTYGQFEKAIVHFHRTLGAHLALLESTD